MKDCIVVGQDTSNNCLVAKFNGTTQLWSVDTSFPTVNGRLWSVFAWNSNNIWVCGGTGDLGTTAAILYQYTGGAWVNHSSDITDATYFHCIHGNSSTNIWVVGTATGAITSGAWQWNGTSWTSTKQNTSSLATLTPSAGQMRVSVSSNGTCYVPVISNAGVGEVVGCQYLYSNKTDAGFSEFADFGSIEIREVKAVSDTEIICSQPFFEGGNSYACIWYNGTSWTRKGRDHLGAIEASWAFDALDNSHFVFIGQSWGTINQIDDTHTSSAEQISTDTYSSLIDNRLKIVDPDNENDIWFCSADTAAPFTPQLRHYEGGTTWSTTLTDYGASYVTLGAKNWHALDNYQQEYSAPAATTPTSDISVQRSKRYNQPFFFAHIEGFPYVWFTKVPSNYTATGNWQFLNGMMLTTHKSNSGSEITIDKAIDLSEPIELPGKISINIIDDDNLLPLTGTSRETRDNTTTLVTNNVAAGSDADLTVDHNISDAAGTVYLDYPMQTITYGSHTGTSFTTINRGRYHSLNLEGAALTENTWKPQIKYSTASGIPPKVTTFPKAIRGRVLTVYLNYFNLDTGLAWPITESYTIFRGPITSFLCDDQFLGFNILADSYIGMTDRPFFASPASVPLRGVHLPISAAGGLEEAFNKEISIRIREVWWYMAGLNDAGDGPNTNEEDYYESWTQDIGSHTGVQEYRVVLGTRDAIERLDNIDDLISLVNQKLAAKNTKAFWHCSRGSDGKVQIWYDPVGYRDNALVPMGSSTVPLWGIKGFAVSHPILTALGFEDDVYQIEVCTLKPWEYQAMMVMRIDGTNGNFSNAWKVAALGHYLPPSVSAKNEPSQAWFRTDSCSLLPVEIEEATDKFVQSPGDGSPFLVQVGNEIIYRANGTEWVGGSINLVDGVYDYEHPIGRSSRNVAKIDRVFSVPASTPFWEVPVVKQVWRPTNTSSITFTSAVSGLTHTIEKKGINYTILQILLSTGTSGYNHTEYDVLPVGWGMSIPAAYVDIDSFEKLADEYSFALLDRDYIFTGPVVMKDFLLNESKLLDFIVTMKDGKLTAVASQDALAENVSATIDDSVRCIDAQINWETHRLDPVRTITMKSDYDVLEDEYYQDDIYTYGASDGQTGNATEYLIENKGIKPESADASTLTEIQAIIQEKLDDLLQERYLYTCEITRKMDTLELGDIVYVTDERVPNPRTGTRGITNHIGKIVAYNFNHRAGRGEIMIEMSYNGSAGITKKLNLSDTQAYFNRGAYGPSEIVKSLNGFNVYLQNYMTPNSTKELFVSGHKVQFTNMNSGALVQGTVSSWIQASRTITLNEDHSSTIDTSTGEWIVTYDTYQNVSVAPTANTQVFSMYIANSSRRLSTPGYTDSEGYTLS